MKILTISEKDICGYGDYVTGIAAAAFVQSGYDHVRVREDNDLTVYPCDIIYLDPKVYGHCLPLVLLGEGVLSE